MTAPGELAFDGPSAAEQHCPLLVSCRSHLRCPVPAATGALQVSYALPGPPLNERFVLGGLEATRITASVR